MNTTTERSINDIIGLKPYVINFEFKFKKPTPRHWVGPSQGEACGSWWGGETGEYAEYLNIEAFYDKIMYRWSRLAKLKDWVEKNGINTAKYQTKKLVGCCPHIDTLKPSKVKEVLDIFANDEDLGMKDLLTGKIKELKLAWVDDPDGIKANPVVITMKKKAPKFFKDIEDNIKRNRAEAAKREADRLQREKEYEERKEAAEYAEYLRLKAKFENK